MHRVSGENYFTHAGMVRQDEINPPRGSKMMIEFEARYDKELDFDGRSTYPFTAKISQRQTKNGHNKFHEGALWAKRSSAAIP
jgi:hypothetical protein